MSDLYACGMANYWKLFKKAKKFYFELKKVHCPALNADIIFDQRGFRHLLLKRRGQRPIADQIRRFRLLFKIPEFLEKATMIEKRKDGAQTAFTSLACAIKGEDVKMIVMQTKIGKIYFISIMNP